MLHYTDNIFFTTIYIYEQLYQQKGFSLSNKLAAV